MYIVSCTVFQKRVSSIKMIITRVFNTLQSRAGNAESFVAARWKMCIPIGLRGSPVCLLRVYYTGFSIRYPQRFSWIDDPRVRSLSIMRKVRDFSLRQGKDEMPGILLDDDPVMIFGGLLSWEIVMFDLCKVAGVSIRR